MREVERGREEMGERDEEIEELRDKIEKVSY